MEDTHPGRHSVLVVQHVVQVFRCDVEPAQTHLHKMTERIALYSEIRIIAEPVLQYCAQVIFYRFSV